MTETNNTNSSSKKTRGDGGEQRSTAHASTSAVDAATPASPASQVRRNDARDGDKPLPVVVILADQPIPDGYKELTLPENLVSANSVDAYMGKAILAENMIMELWQDLYWEDCYVRIIKQNEDGDWKSFTLDMDKLKTLLSLGRSLAEAADRRDNAGTLAKKFSLGNPYFMSYHEYKDAPVVDIRKYFSVENEWKPTRKGICLRLANFVRVLDGAEKLQKESENIKKRAYNIVKAITEVKIRKMIISEMRKNCKGCKEGSDKGDEDHWDGCENSWEEFLRRYFGFVEISPMHDEVERMYVEVMEALGIPKLFFTTIFWNYTCGNSDGIYEDLDASLTREDPEQRKLYTLVYKLCKLNEDDWEVCENRE